MALIIFFENGACQTIQTSIHTALTIQIGIAWDAAKGSNRTAEIGHSLSKAGEFIMKPNVTPRSLNRSLLAASVLAAVTGFVATAPTAQAQSLAYGQRIPPSTRSMEAEWNGRSVAQTGATVPNPGTAKIGPQTEAERRAQERSARAIRTICTGCL